jgi:hypothetical protein
MARRLAGRRAISATSPRRAPIDGIHFAVALALEVPLGREEPALQLGHADRRPRALPGHPRQLRASRATRRGDRSGRWLDAAPEAAFLVTTRERLHRRARRSFPVEPLPLDARMRSSSSSARARAQRPTSR